MQTSSRTRAAGAMVFTFVGVALGACASEGQGEGSETHFACRADADCPATLPYCVSEACSDAPAPGDGGAGGGGSGGTGGSAEGGSGGGTCGPTPPAEFRCVQFCGTDRPALDMICVDGQYECPAETPVRLSDCPADTCWFPGAGCCLPDGSRVDGSCPDGGEMVCPEGSAPPVNGCTTECSAEPVTGGSTSIDFRIENASGAPIGLWQGCQVVHSIHSCMDGYAEALTTWAFCTPQCPSTDCGVCGACFSEPLPVTGSSVIAFDGNLLETIPTGDPLCSCVEPSAAPPGKYRVRVPVFDDTPATSGDGTPYTTVLYVVEADFQLPDDDGVVTIPIDVAPYVAPCAGGSCLVRLDPADPAYGCTPEPAPGSCPADRPARYRCDAPVPLTEGCIDPESRDMPPAVGGVVRCCP